ncbi:5'-nucleotidase, lipoprotein e(P4) family [Balneolaceae bacterium YR4-1]|uniref:5'-nucleotidase, lipoprotein e(P4) family n=1 Tax=Halalkalibaculum roseum TaxID=2709311 RepID=A0A6M1T7Y8_9BACT|nr:HAD family acid phosphatase [Halalkalibaculum roseum]NGP76393.1 5'-nucleotidase, lipoprotein e(P4) family [Halalkalibaculum roseum]
MLSILFISCAPGKEISDHPTTQATLWVQNAAEYQALTTMVYQTAASNIALAKEDSYWSAIPSQDNNYHNLPPAVILDVDETVLDNSAFQARMIKQGAEFDLAQWNEWVMEAQADPVPGSLKFTQQAAKEGIKVIYLTNREASVEEGTRKNLQELGYPLPDSGDVILSKNERKEWTSDKINRRNFVADNYRVLMLFGDDLNDFIPAKEISESERMRLINDNRQRWGQKWYILPNPVYGSWEQALYNFNSSLTDEEKEEIILQKLETKNVKK